MTEPHDHLPELDEEARAAAAGLREHVLDRVDVTASLAELPVTPAASGRGRVLAVAAVIALLVGSLAVLNQGTGDGRDRTGIDMDGDALPDLEPGVLRPLGPRDGRDSIQLPITADPQTGLLDGDRVTVSGEGFVPGERVGIVQCAREAGGDSPETRGGVDGCNIGNVTYADADDAGVATGALTVSRALTTPLTGTVDCAAEAERCIVAMGALTDYDRSGGQAVAFAFDGEPLTLPTVEVTPTEGLSDGDLVHLRIDGLTPGSEVWLSVCSSDPTACWQTAPEGDADRSRREPGAVSVDGDGVAEVDVPVWRFLPGPEPGTYVDCAVSRCSLRFGGTDTTPASVPLSFLPGGDGPAAPVLAVDPATALAIGDEVIVRGSGFRPNGQVHVSLCAAPPGAGAWEYFACASEDPEQRADETGSFQITFRIPDLGSVDGGYSEECFADGTCATVSEGSPTGTPIRCDDGSADCYLTVDPYGEGYGVGPPVFTVAPVKVTFR